MEIIDRVKSPTPDFFKKIRKKALILTTAATIAQTTKNDK